MATFLGGFEHSTIAAAVFLVGLGYAVAVGFYRLLLHPLTGIPGPKIAALTGWYEFYWQCPKKGHYIFRVQEMHQEYGENSCFAQALDSLPDKNQAPSSA